MKTNRRRIISKSLYVLAGIILVIAIWTFFTQVATVAQMFKAGELQWTTKSLDIFTFFVQNSILLLIRAIIIAFIGYEVSHGYAASANKGTLNNYVSNAVQQEEEITEVTVPHPLTLQDGIIKTYLKEKFLRLDSNYSEVFFDSDEKIEILEAYDSVDGDSEVLLFEATDTWNTLEAAKENLQEYYELELSGDTMTVETNKLIISEVSDHGIAKGFHVLELGVDIEAYLFLDIDDSIFVIRYITNKKKDSVIQSLKKIKVSYR